MPMPWPSLFAHAGWIADMLFPGIPLVAKVLRPVVVYLFLILGLRVFGKRELAQLNPFDLIVLLMLSNTVQNAIIGDDTSVTGGLLGALALLSVNYLLVRYLFKHRRLDQIVEGKPTVLIDRGRVSRKALARELITLSELRSVAHRQGFSDLEEIEHCALEPGGTFAIIGRTPREVERHHSELIARLDHLSRQFDELRASLAPAGEPALAPGKGAGAAPDGPR